MPQGSTAVRPTNGLYLYLLPYSYKRHYGMERLSLDRNWLQGGWSGDRQVGARFSTVLFPGGKAAEAWH